MARWSSPGIFVLVILSIGQVFGTLHAAPAPEVKDSTLSALLDPLHGLEREPISLKDYRERVLEWNESVQISLLEVEATRQRREGEVGIFEPEVVASYEHTDSTRPNTAEQQRQQFTSQFKQRNNIYNMGLESLIPGGARVRLGYSLSDLNNNLQEDSIFGNSRTNGSEWLSFVGINLTQPLLRNGGYDTSMASLRLAAVTSDVAFQQYRRRIMETVATAESLYWQLYFVQEQLHYFEESVAVATALLHNNRQRLEIGNGSELEVMEAESGLALRLTRQAEAAQKLVEVSNALISLYSSTVLETNRLLQATDHPEPGNLPHDLFNSWRKAQELNPDYLGQKRQVSAEMIRQGYARNQRLPQLDLKGSVGYYGLSETAAGSMSDVNTGDFPAATIGLEMRVPLGGSKSRGEYRAAQLRRKQAELSLQDIETQMINGVDAALRKARSTQNNITNYTTVASFYQNLFDTQQTRMEFGAVDSQTLLRTEEKLFEARNSVVESLTLHMRARLELELAQGDILINRNLELTRDDLEHRTSTLTDERIPDDDRFTSFHRELQQELQRRSPEFQPDTPEHQAALETLQSYQPLPPEPLVPPADHSDPAIQQQAIEALREAMQETSRPEDSPAP